MSKGCWAQSIKWAVHCYIFNEAMQQWPTLFQPFYQPRAANVQGRKVTVTETSAHHEIKLSDPSSCVWEGEFRSWHLRGDGNLGPCLLLDLLQVAALLSNQPAYVVVASDDLQRDVFHPTPTNTRSFGYTWGQVVLSGTFVAIIWRKVLLATWIQQRIKEDVLT